MITVVYFESAGATVRVDVSKDGNAFKFSRNRGGEATESIVFSREEAITLNTAVQFLLQQSLPWMLTQERS